MDDIFIQRGPRAKKANGVKGANSANGMSNERSRKLQAIAHEAADETARLSGDSFEALPDEENGMAALTPDERRLKKQAESPTKSHASAPPKKKSAQRKQDDEDDDGADQGGVFDSKRLEEYFDHAEPSEPAKGIDSLFAKKGGAGSGPSRPRKAAPPEDSGNAGGLFAKKGGGSAARSQRSEEEQDGKEEGQEDEEDSLGGLFAPRVPGARPKRVETTPAVPEGILRDLEQGEIIEESNVKVEPTKQARQVKAKAPTQVVKTIEPKRDLSKYTKPLERCAEYVCVLLTILLFFGGLGAVSYGLWIGCEGPLPLVGLDVCIEKSPVQQVTAAMPAIVILGTLCCCICYRVQSKEKRAKDSWALDSDAQKNAAAVLEALEQTPTIEHKKYLKQAVTIMKDFESKAIIQQKACTALEAVCRAQRGAAATVQSAGAVHPILTALELHLRVRAVQRAGLGCLACLAKVARQEIFDKGGVSITLSSMTKFKRDALVQVSGAMVIGALCQNASHIRKSVAKFGGMNQLSASLKRFDDRCDVLIAVSEAMVIVGEESSLRKDIGPNLPVVQEHISRIEDRTFPVQLSKMERDAALRSLRKLEDKIQSLREAIEDDNSEAGTPRQAPHQVAAAASAQATVHKDDLVHRSNRWGTNTWK